MLLKRCARGGRQNVLGISRIIIQDANIAALNPSLNNYPHPVHSSVYDATVLTTLYVKQQLRLVPCPECFSLLSLWNLERVWMRSVAIFCGD
jgi:hypothetical protein